VCKTETLKLCGGAPSGLQVQCLPCCSCFRILVKLFKHGCFYNCVLEPFAVAMIRNMIALNNGIELHHVRLFGLVLITGNGFTLGNTAKITQHKTTNPGPPRCKSDFNMFVKMALLTSLQVAMCMARGTSKNTCWEKPAIHMRQSKR